MRCPSTSAPPAAATSRSCCLSGSARGCARAAVRAALLVECRHSRGGHASQLLLERLAGRRLGYKVSRWGTPTPYPAYSVVGPRVCLTNEMAGSDGDIFSHAWKML